MEYFNECNTCGNLTRNCTCFIHSLPDRFQMGPLNGDLLVVAIKLQTVIDVLNKLLAKNDPPDETVAEGKEP